MLFKKTNNRTKITPKTQPSFLYYRGNRKASRTTSEFKKQNIQPKSFKQKMYVFGNILLVFGVIVLIGFFSTLSNDPKINVADNSLLSSKYNDLQTSTKEIFYASPLNRTKFTVNSKEFSQKIKQKHPEVGNATISIPFFTRQPTITLSAIQPAFIHSANNNSYIIDEFGVVVSRIQDIKSINKLNLITLNDEAGLKVDLGKPVISEDQTNFIREIIYQLQKAGQKVRSVDIPVSAYDINIRLDGKNYFIKMNMLGDARAQSGRYMAAEKYLSETNKKPSEYIDVRVDERVFIK